MKYSARFHLLLGFLALFLLVGVLGVWSVKARLAGAVIASGTVEVESNKQVIEHPDGGVVAKIVASDGTEVRAGDPLLQLDDKLLSSELQIIDQRYFELRALQARLKAERDGLAKIEWLAEIEAAISQDRADPELTASQERLLTIRRENAVREADQIDIQITQINKQISGIDAQLEAFETQSQLIQEELADTQTLFDKNLTQASRLLAIKREAAGLLGSVGSLTSQSAQLSSRIAELELTKIRLDADRREEAIEELSKLEPQIAELAERKLGIQTQLDRLTLRAPMDGIIYGSQVFAENSVISPAEPVMFIVPQSQPLVLTTRIEAIHVDQVFLGQSATLRFPSFDQRLTPEIDGEVTRVSADAFTEETTGGKFYEVTLAAKENEIEKLGENTLVPGMPVEAFIQTAERSPLEYLMKPLTDYFSRAMRES